MSQEKIATLSEIESMPEFQNRGLDYFRNLKPTDYKLPMEDINRQFSVSPETLKVWAERPEDTFFKRQAKGLWAGVKRTGFSIQDIGQKFDNALMRHTFPVADDEKAQRLIALGMWQSGNRARHRQIMEHYEGTDDSIAADISGAFGSALTYLGVGLGGAALGGAPGALTAIGTVAAGQTAVETMEDYAQKYIRETGDYSLKDYDQTADDIALGYGAISGFIEAALGIEGVIAGSIRRATTKAGARRFLLGGIGEGAEEFLQETTGGVAGAITGYEDRTAGQVLKDAVINAAYGALVGGTLGTGMFYYHRNKLAKQLREDYGFDDPTAKNLADTLIDTAATQTEKEASTVVSLQEHFGDAFDSLVGKIESALDAAGWESSQIDPKTNKPYDKHEYSKVVATDIAFQTLRQAKINKVPVSTVLDLAEIESVDNVIYLKPQNLGSVEAISNKIAEKKAQIKRLTELAKTGAGDASAKSLLRTQVAVLQNLLDLKKSQLKAKQDARPQELKDRSELAKTDVKALEKSDNVVDFAKNISTPDQQVTPVEAKKRHDDATLMWSLDGDKNAFESLIEIGNTGNKVLSGILNSIESIYQFQKENPEIDLRADIQGALKRLPDALSGNFAEYVSLPSNFNENALLYAFAFGSADDINTFLNKYMDKIKANKENGKFQAGTFDKSDVYSQCLQMFESAFKDGVATDPNMRGVMLSKETKDTYYHSVVAKKTDVSTKADIKEMRADAKSYFNNVIKKQDINHPVLGHIIVSNKGIDEFIHYSANKDKLALVPHLKELIETSTVSEKKELTHKRKDGLVAFYELYNDANIDGKPYNTTTYIGVDRNGKLFYDVKLNENSQTGGLDTKSSGSSATFNITITPESENVNLKVLQKTTGNINLQGSKKQGMYDPELQVIIIGRDFNTGTLPHEMAHFWLDDIFRRATTYNDWTPEFIEQANNLFAILGIEENQKQLTREQHEKFARMVENIVFGLQPAPAGAELPTLAYLNWIPEKYKSIADIRYKDEDGTYHYPLLDKDAADFFNAWYSNTSLPDIGTSPLEIQNENFTDRNGDVVPSTPEIMKLRDNTQEQAVKDQADVDKEMHDSGVENTPTDTRAEMVAYNTQASREATTPEPVVQPQPKKKSILRIGRGTNTRAEMIEEAQKYIEKNKDHAEEIAFGDPELVENDSGIERGILIREVMNNYKKGSQEYATLYDNLARTMSLAGKTGGLNNDIQVRFYLEGYSRLNKAMEAKAAAKYAGSNRGAITKFNQDIQAFIASKADAILATEPGSKERNDLIDAMIREAEIKFAGGTGDARMLFQENNFGQKARRQNKADFMKWADKEIKKMLKANPESDPNVISELITKSEKAQVARTQLDSKDVNQCVAAAQILREWQAYTDSLDDVVLDNQISKLNRWFRKIVGGWQPFAMLTNINTHTTNMVSNTINLATVQASLAAQYGKSQVDSALIKKESDRIWAIYNATQMDISQMLNPATPSLLHGEKIDVNAKNKLRVLDTRMWLGKEDLLFRSKMYLSTLAHIATKNAKASGKSANELFEQYCNLTQDPGSEAEQARQQAVLMGNIATFTQNGKFSGMLQKVRTEINKFTDPTGRAGFGTMLAPFIKTPANIVALGVSSPIGFAKTIAHIAHLDSKLKLDWNTQDALGAIYFLLAIVLSAAVDDYEKEYESGKKYDPTKPYDSVNFGGKAWFKLDLFGALETPLRFLSALKTNKGLGISGVVNSTPLAGDISESISGIERASKSREKLLSFGINYAYNQVNKSVPAIIKQTANLANMTDLNLEQVDIGIKTGIGRKVGRQYGLDAQERTDVELYNDILGTFFNRLKLTE